MKIHLLIRDIGYAQPVVEINGTNGGIFGFAWDRKRAAHVRTYDLSKGEAELKRFRREQMALLNQPLHFPITLDVSESEEAPVSLPLNQTIPPGKNTTQAPAADPDKGDPKPARVPRSKGGK